MVFDQTDFSSYASCLLVIIVIGVAFSGCSSSVDDETSFQATVSENESEKKQPEVNEYGLFSTEDELIEVFGKEDTKTILDSIVAIKKGHKLFRFEQEFENSYVEYMKGMSGLDTILCGPKFSKFNELPLGVADSDILIVLALKAIIIRTHITIILGEGSREEYPLKCVWTSPAFVETRSDLLNLYRKWWGGDEDVFNEETLEEIVAEELE